MTQQQYQQQKHQPLLPKQHNQKQQQQQPLLPKHQLRVPPVLLPMLLLAT
jgi:hypothetical protein